MAEKRRVVRRGTVTATERLSPDMVRITLSCPELVGAELPHSDHYVKLLFPPKGADYAWPFDPEEIRANSPHQAPVTRTYSLRRRDTATGTLELDFVLHGDDGLAGPWAAAAQPGDEIGFFGPGGAWHPIQDYTHFVLAGDEAAAPAIAAALDALPEGATARALIEVASLDATFDVPTGPGIDVVWVPRDGAPYGLRLSEAVRAVEVPEGKVGWFVHGVAEMVKDIRRYLFVDRSVPRADVSISGYWRTGMTEDGWQSSKHDFVAQMDAEESAAAQPR